MKLSKIFKYGFLATSLFGNVLASEDNLHNDLIHDDIKPHILNCVSYRTCINLALTCQSWHKAFTTWHSALVPINNLITIDVAPIGVYSYISLGYTSDSFWIFEKSQPPKTFCINGYSSEVQELTTQCENIPGYISAQSSLQYYFRYKSVKFGEEKFLTMEKDLKAVQVTKFPNTVVEKTISLPLEFKARDVELISLAIDGHSVVVSATKGNIKNQSRICIVINNILDDQPILSPAPLVFSLNKYRALRNYNIIDLHLKNNYMFGIISLPLSVIMSEKHSGLVIYDYINQKICFGKFFQGRVNSSHFVGSTIFVETITSLSSSPYKIAEPEQLRFSSFNIKHFLS